MVTPGQDMTYPLRFDPIYQYRLWGGRRLENWLNTPLPGDGPIGEAWLLSDRDEYPSRVSDGPLKGRTIAQLMEQSSREILGRLAPRFRRFPLLLKFLDVQKMLSVQVHPSDGKTQLIPYGDTGKTEAWVVLESGPRSRIYAGLKPGATPADLRSISKRTADDYLASFTPADGQSVLIEAGTVHSIGGEIVVFEVQENSDVTFRLYDWDHIDATTGYLRIMSFSGYAQGGFANGEAALEAALDEIFSDPELKALVIDVRINFGGDDPYGLSIASRLANREYLAYTKYARADAIEHDKWTPADLSVIRPSSRPGFRGPVVELMGPLTISAGETFTQALMGRTPHVTRIGENTQGVFSDVLVRKLPNGWVFGLPNEVYRTSEGIAFDGVGISPDIAVPVFAASDLPAGKDPEMERALQILRNK